MSQSKPSRRQPRPVSPVELDDLLSELEIEPQGETSFELVSTWAAKHVWRVYVQDEPFAVIRYLLGTSHQLPEQWRHLRLAQVLHEARVGPRVLGLTESSSALNGRAAIVEAAFACLEREDLEARPHEAVSLLARLHSNGALHEELSRDLNEADRQGLSPLGQFFTETRERWFDAVVPRWLAAGLPVINDLTPVISDLLLELERLRAQTRENRIEIVVPSHTDPNHGNFMVNRQGALRMIDFEGLALNNPVVDLGIFLTWYVDPENHRELLDTYYPLADTEAILERMQVWVPLRYLDFAAHWAARLTRAKDQVAWDHAGGSIFEWLHGAAELIYAGDVPLTMSNTITDVTDGLLALENWQQIVHATDADIADDNQQ